ncbi:hypothetical protein [Kutzneria buriramensis]|uniref:Uncharacterized protein n=1 Tax=Kutzneria buriramensis TaxID=1045776 RepID=A0A3E0GVA5_9PSEU|nr:hypothetical protein [Kutzneria buriramensis]REH26429.1 hypothetical protein BCF44_13349 [Kutzneria buriramensis]
MHKGVVSRLTAVVTLAQGLLAVPAAAAPGTGNATYFAGLGSPYGGCGLPQAALDSQNFVALNEFDTPVDHGWHQRPIPASMSNIIDSFDNGHDCGRYVQVTIGDYCTGTNDDASGQPFCRNGSWVSDKYDGATLTMLDSCADSNAWCRDDPNNLDLAQNSLNLFAKAGQPVGDLRPNHWSNRHISWQFVPAPGYAGDIRVGFVQSAQPYRPVVAISHLPNGIHGVQYYSNGAWHAAPMDSDMGQDHQIAPTSTSQGTQYQIRAIDASDATLGRAYQFSLPPSCADGCGLAYTAVPYTTS